jgi:hypothetical protein
LEDKNGKQYSGYITLDKETGKPDFMFPKQYKDALEKGLVIPDNRQPQSSEKPEKKQQEMQKKSKGMKV